MSDNPNGLFSRFIDGMASALGWLVYIFLVLGLVVAFRSVYHEPTANKSSANASANFEISDTK